MKSVVILLFFVFGCSKVELNYSKDHFSPILRVMQSKDLVELNKVFGKPDKKRIENENKRNEKIYSYNSSKSFGSITAYVDENSQKVLRMTFFFWADFDNYEYLKNRFKGYKWIETKEVDNNNHVVTDNRLVEIPELKIFFHYDNNSPKRKVMWIVFD
ncbi:MAG: hypothetical protein CME70_09725 [Halobacteriovorax sp.]|nr:hypothetical protein [Halobacteriovorax sp.]|tara:strand:- start:126486 stop:126959 length:474 start_codon:yes stop_codon:yes gene_type:complete